MKYSHYSIVIVRVQCCCILIHWTEHPLMLTPSQPSCESWVLGQAFTSRGHLLPLSAPVYNHVAVDIKRSVRSAFRLGQCNSLSPMNPSESSMEFDIAHRALRSEFDPRSCQQLHGQRRQCCCRFSVLFPLFIPVNETYICPNSLLTSPITDNEVYSEGIINFHEFLLLVTGAKIGAKMAVNVFCCDSICKEGISATTVQWWHRCCTFIVVNFAFRLVVVDSKQILN